jgi:hypothetical protein
LFLSRYLVIVNEKTALWAAYPNQIIKLPTLSKICLFEWLETGVISSLVQLSSKFSKLPFNDCLIIVSL